MAPERPSLEEGSGGDSSREGGRGAAPLAMVHSASERSGGDPPVAVPLGTREFHCQQIFPSANGIVRIQEGDGASDSLPDVHTVVETSYEDNDLTSLTWLQDRNLLKGMNLRSGDSLSPEGDGHLSNDDEGDLEEEDDGLNPIGGTISPTSDYADSTSSGGGRRSPDGSPDDRDCKKLRRQPVLLSHPMGNPSLPIMTRLKLQHSSNQSHVGPAAGNQRTYNPQVHVRSKPPFSFSCLIFMAIEDSAKKALPVKEIYAWILEHFPYFKDAPTGWKNSVRHNLSLNKCFKKVEKAQNLGKGSLWMVDDIFRPNLLQALKKAPFQTHNTHLDSVITNGLNVKSPSPSSGDYIVLSGTKSNCNVPDPELFPLLSRRLAAASGKDSASMSSDVSSQRRRHRNAMKTRDAVPLSKVTSYSSDSLEDVDAAAAMLALKHGPHVLFSGKDGWQPEEVNALKDYSKGYCARKTLDKTSNTNQSLPVITSSPSEDHTYSAGQQVGLSAVSATLVSQWSSQRQHLPIPLMALSSSPDEAFSEGSSESDDSVTEQPSRGVSLKLAREECDLEEQRKIAEGADALLNLAGICTVGEEEVGSRGGGSVEGGGLPKGARRKRRPDGSPVDLSSPVKVRVLEGKEPQGETLHPNQEGRGSVRFSRAKKGWSHSGNKVSITTGHSGRARGLNVRLKKKQARRVEEKIFRMKR